MAESGLAAWQLKLLDHVQLSGPDGDAGLTASKAIAVLGYLALQRNRTARRDTIAGLLWENVETAQGRVNLRQALTAVRRVEASSPAILRADADTLALADTVETDVDRFDRLTRGGSDERRAAAELFHTDVMAGFSVRDAPAFNEWLAIVQAQWRQKAVGLLMELADESLGEGGDLNAGAAAALKLLAIDPLNEAGHRALMRIYARQGRAALAIAQYRGLGELLRTELQVAPDAETQALFEELSRGRRQPPTASLAKPAALPSSKSPSTGASEPHAHEALPPPVAAATSIPDPSDPGRRSRSLSKFAIVAATGLLVACVAAGMLWLWTDRHEPPRIKRIFSIAATDDQETGPAISPDGRTLVYSVRRANNLDLYSISVDGRGQPVRLTDNPLEDKGAAWSPDGRKIAFARGNRGSDEPCTILVMDIPARVERVVGRCRSQPSTQLAWEHSGRSLLFNDDVDRNRSSQIFRLPLSGGVATPVSHPTEDVFGDERPLPSSNGRRLAIVRYFGLDSAAVVVQDSSGTLTTPVPNTPGLFDAAWSSGERGLVYSIPEGSQAGLWWQSNDPKSPRIRLTTGPSAFSSISFAPGANRLAVQVSQDRRTIFRLPANASSLSAQQSISGFNPEVSDRYVAEAYDGSIALVSSRSGSDDLWTVRPGQSLRQLTRGYSFGQPAWSPNGRFIAASSDADGQSDIFIVEARSGKVRRVTNDAASDTYPNWSSDGRFLFWSSLRGGAASVWIFEAANPARPLRQLIGSGIGLITAGPPGDNAYYYTRFGPLGLFRRPFDSSGEFTGRETLILPKLVPTRAPSWAVTSTGIIYPLRDQVTGRRLLYRHDMTSGRDKPIEGSEALSGRLAFSPTPNGGTLVNHTLSQNDITGIDFE